MDRIRTVVLRYLPAELLALAGMFAGWWLATRWTQSPWLIAGVVTVAENVGFYGYLAVCVWREQTPQNPRLARRAQRTALLLGAEFGPAEVIDSFLIRPAFMTAAMVWLHSTGWGVLVGSYAADAVFWSVAGTSYLLTVKLGWRHRRVELSITRFAPDAPPALSTIDYLAEPDIAEFVAAQGTPLLVLDPASVERRYREMRCTLPGVEFHYAVKANPHPAIIDSLNDLGASFEVATTGELDLLLDRGVVVDRIIYTHPVKTAEDIRYAVACGVMTFVADTAREVAKLAAYDVRVLVRVAVPNETAQIDLSTKFGVPLSRARDLIVGAHRAGVSVAGLSFHVGSQQCDAGAWAGAVRAALELIDELASDVQLEVLDLGGGFPVAYHAPVPSLQQIAAEIGPLLAGRLPALRVIAEPGRYLAAESMTAITSVVGVGQRDDRAWYYLDDGVHGSYSNVLQEKVVPQLLTCTTGPRKPATLAGPTCDGLDVIALDVALPTLEAGDLVVSPMMGAYTSVTANGFNGIRPTPIVVRPARRWGTTKRPSATAGDDRRPLRSTQRAAEPST